MKPNIRPIIKSALSFGAETTLPKMNQIVDSSNVETRWISCNACGADAFCELLKVGVWHIGRCSVCSLLYVNPMPFFRKTDYHDISQDYYYTKLQPEITPANIEFEKQQIRSQFEQISSLPPHHLRCGRFLDVGCGPGLTVYASIALGWEAVGVDIDHQLIRLGKERLGVDLRCSDIMESRFVEDQFTFVRLKSVLHMVPNPYDVLVEVKRTLSPGGVVLIIVPNEHGLLNQVNLLFGRKRKNRLGTLLVPFHTHAFTPTTLRRILVRSGLKIRLVKTTTPIDPVYATIGQMKSTSVKRNTLGFVWRCAKAIRRGSILVAYAGK